MGHHKVSRHAVQVIVSEQGTSQTAWSEAEVDGPDEVEAVGAQILVLVQSYL